MIKQLLCFCSRLRLSAQANAPGDRAVDQLVFRRGCENEIESFISSGFVDLFHPEVALQSLSSNRPLLHTQSGIAVRETGIIEVSVIAQTSNDFVDIGFRGAAALQ